jgi:hypothetical protein
MTVYELLHDDQMRAFIPSFAVIVTAAWFEMDPVMFGKILAVLERRNRCAVMPSSSGAIDETGVKFI